MRKKPILLRLLPWIIAAVVIAAFVIVLDMIYSHTGKSFARDTKIISFEGDGKPFVMENDQLLFEMDGATSQFKVTNKETGKVCSPRIPGEEGLKALRLAVAIENEARRYNEHYGFKFSPCSPDDFE